MKAIKLQTKLVTLTSALIAVGAAMSARKPAAQPVPRHPVPAPPGLFSTCNDRLIRIDAAISSWTASFTNRPTPADLLPKLGTTRFPNCPQGGAYTLGTSFHATTCSLHGIASFSGTPPPPRPEPSAMEKLRRATIGRLVQVRGHHGQTVTCIANLRQLDGAKQQWAIDEKKNGTDTPLAEELFGRTLYLKNPPKCPYEGKYVLGTVAENPRCTVQGHSL